MTQINTPTTFVNRSAPQAHPVFLLKPIQFPTPNNPGLKQPATVIRPILSSNINLSVTRPPLVRRFLRPTSIRPFPPRLIPPGTSFIQPTSRIDPVIIQNKRLIREPSVESSLTTLSTISSNPEKLIEEKTCCHCLPCCRPKDEQHQQRSSSVNNRSIHNFPNFKLKTRTVYIILSLVFLFFLIVIILLIVLIVVRR